MSLIDIGQPDLAGLSVTMDAQSTETAFGLVNRYLLAAGQAAPVAGERALTRDQCGDQHHSVGLKQVRGHPGTVTDVSAIVAALRGSSPGMFCLTLPTRSAPTSE